MYTERVGRNAPNQRITVVTDILAPLHPIVATELLERNISHVDHRFIPLGF